MGQKLGIEERRGEKVTGHEGGHEDGQKRFPGRIE